MPLTIPVFSRGSLSLSIRTHEDPRPAPQIRHALAAALHNGGTGTALAAAAGKLDTMGLASAIFSPWMNIAGSLLANWWRRRPPAPSSGSGR